MVDLNSDNFDRAFQAAVNSIPFTDSNSYWRHIVSAEAVPYENERVKNIRCFQILFHCNAYKTSNGQRSEYICLQIHPIGHTFATGGNVSVGHIHLREVWNGIVEPNVTFGQIDHFFYPNKSDFSGLESVNNEALNHAFDETENARSQLFAYGSNIEQSFPQYFEAIKKYNQILRSLAAASSEHQFKLQ